MKSKLEQRYNDLKAEYEAGQKMLADLDARRGNLTSTLLRIEGAMQVLKEMIEADPPGNVDDSKAPEA
jgi:hypothetical protein